MNRPDLLQRLVFSEIDARSVWVQLDGVFEQVLERGDYPALVADLLGRLLLIAAAMSSGIKFDGRITVQLQSKGPVPLLLADCDDDGGLRAMARVQENAELPEGRDALFETLAETGTLALTVEPSEHGQRWQGIVPLEGGSIETAIEHYFARSEQLPTRFRMAVEDHRAGALMVQRMPGERVDADGWNRLGHLIDTLADQEMLSLDGEQVLHRLFHAEERRLFPARPLVFHCPCSRERVATVLQGLGRGELQSLAAEQEEVEVRCEFCNEAYRFDRVDLASLQQEGPADDSSTVH